MSFDLGAVLRQGLEVALRRRVLWLYGLLLTLLGGECFRFAGGGTSTSLRSRGVL